MNDETRKQIALSRYKLISPVLAEPGRIQNEYFRMQSRKEHLLPHYGSRAVATSTFKRWLRLYRRGGFEALKPKSRSDVGRPRRLGPEAVAAIRGKCKAFPYWSVRKLYEELREGGQLGDPPASYNTLLRLVQHEKLLPVSGRTDIRKRYELAEVNELWVCDFLHGPTVHLPRRSARAILCAVIDDHSRMIVGYSFSTQETVSVLTMVLKEAFGAYGLPKRLYVDNGPAFSSDLLTHSCALAGISLIHSKPYDSPSRGKIERFFRTTRDRFFSGLCPEPSLEEINQAFSLWLKDDYHHKLHTGIGQRPIDRYNASAERVDIRRLSRAELDQIFLVRHERIVNNDATISFKGKLYEVPAAYIRQRIEIRHPVDDPDDLYLFDGGARIARLKLLDARQNARTFQPAKADTPVSFADRSVTS
jgi:putative transposase